MALPRLIAKSTLGGAEIAQASRDVRKWTPKRDKTASPTDRGAEMLGAGSKIAARAKRGAIGAG